MAAVDEGPVGRKRSLSDVEPSSPADRKRTRTVEPDEKDEGEITDSKSAISVSSPAGESFSPDQKSAHNGWNVGVNGGLRISFPTLKKPSQSGPPEAASETPEEPLKAKPSIAGLITPDGYPSQPKNSRRRSWDARFKHWCIELMRLNKNHGGVQDPEVLREAWSSWLQNRKNQDPLAQTAALRAAQKFEFTPETLTEMASAALAPESNPVSSSELQSDHSAGKAASDTSKSDNNKPLTTWEMRGMKLPPRPDQSSLALDAKDDQVWETKFTTWCQELAELNTKKIRTDGKRDFNRILRAYNQWIGTIDGLPKVRATAARRNASNYLARNKDKVAALLAGRPLEEQEPKEDDTKEENPQEEDSKEEEHQEEDSAPATNEGDDVTSIPLTEGELAYRDRYFPGLAPDAVFCVMCASSEHNSAECPEMTCKFCNKDHPCWTCPSRQRCSKCKQLGHSVADCKERLMLAKEEMECALCGSRDHLEYACVNLTRSFRPNPAKIPKVKSLPVFCYRCGSEGHYGGDCGLSALEPKGRSFNPWTKANASQYVDPNSPEVALAYRGQHRSDHKSGGRPDLGKSIVPRQHIQFESDDDDDDEFIQPIVQKPPRSGHITFSGYNGNGNQNQQNNNARHPSSLPPKPPAVSMPPLPPGPPPPLPPGNSSEWDRNKFGRKHGGGGGGGRGGGRSGGGGGGRGRGRY
ncbi:hypothetical protein B0T21DRAFT_280686 [Apiosordaria backusii]|uniref:CCHC-type domain-containing protein n=1 Tax=Apiosordaria backusii TaxID=314023 RepID=A0AA40ETY6_9PEZI|nr:hypothetical protein B0T21DRAFT_280686 [Apiosordaria backusii]